MKDRSVRKGIIGVILFIFCIQAGFSVFGMKAEAANKDFKIEKGVLLKYYGSKTDVTIPSDVKTIGSEAFINSEITSVKLSSSVTEIAENAFKNNTKLKSITLTGSLKTIGDGAFWGCTRLEKIEIPDSVKTIGENAFYNCNSLKSVKLGKAVAVISKRAFVKCSALTGIELPKSVKTLGDEAFLDCTALKTVKVDKSLTDFGIDSFENTAWLTDKRNKDPFVVVNSVLIDAKTQPKHRPELPKGIKKIGAGAFRDCDVVWEITLPDSITSIGREAFAGSDRITGIVIPKKVTVIADRAFAECGNLKNIKLSASLKEIGTEAFIDCLSLKSVTKVPKTLAKIGRQAFAGTQWLKNKKGNNTVTPLIEMNGILIDGTLCSGEIIIPDTVKTIATGAFENAENLKAVRIGSSVKKIEAGAFVKCRFLESVTVSTSVKKIAKGAFSSNPLLTQISYDGTKKELKSSLGITNGKIDGITVQFLK